MKSRNARRTLDVIDGTATRCVGEKSRNAPPSMRSVEMQHRVRPEGLGMVHRWMRRWSRAVLRHQYPGCSLRQVRIRSTSVSVLCRSGSFLRHLRWLVRRLSSRHDGRVQKHWW